MAITGTWHADAILDRLAAAMARGMDDAGRLAVDSAKDQLDTPFPPASRPGQPPHRRSGNLQSAQDHWVERESRGATLHVNGGRVPSKAAVYAGIVHRRRPWLRRSVDMARAGMIDAIGDALRRELR